MPCCMSLKIRAEAVCAMAAQVLRHTVDAGCPSWLRVGRVVLVQHVPSYCGLIALPDQIQQRMHPMQLKLESGTMAELTRSMFTEPSPAYVRVFPSAAIASRSRLTFDPSSAALHPFHGHFNVFTDAES